MSRRKLVFKVVSSIAFLFVYSYVYSLSLYAFLLNDVVSCIFLVLAAVGSIALAYVLGRLRLSTNWFIILLALPAILVGLELGYLVVFAGPQTLTTLIPPMLTTIPVAVVYYKVAKSR